MKNQFKLLGIAVIAAITLFSMVSCEGPTQTVVTYTVTFDTNGGSGTVPSAQTVSPGSSVTLPDGSGLTKSGYIFGGWNTNEDGTGSTYQSGDSYTPTDNITLYTMWMAKFVSELTIAMWDSGSDGWDSNAALRININGFDRLTDVRLTDGVTDYYRFDVETGDVVQIYWVNGGQYDREIAFAVYYSDDPPNPEFDPLFGTTDTNKVLVSKLYNNPSGTVGDGTLMGSFTVDDTASYTISFDLNGGSGTTPSRRVRVGSSVTLPSGSGLSTKTGYIFGGWNTDPSGMGTNYDANSLYTVTGDVTLYANWVIAYTITFDANGGNGTVPSARTISSGSSIILPDGSGLTSTGYSTFGGWSTEPSGMGTNYDAGSSYTVTGDVTLYVRWITNIYNVIFDINGGSGTTPSAQTASLGFSITLPSGDWLTKPGYTFGGWNTESSGTGTNYDAGSSCTVTGDVILYATWQLNGPSTPSASAVSSSITVTWGEVSNADEYYVYRSSSASGTYTRVGTTLTASYTDTGLSENTTYYYKVSAYYNSLGESLQSSYASAKIPPTSIPSVPTVSASAASSSSIMVSWMAFSNADGYYVYRSLSASGTYTYVGTTLTASYTDTGLSMNTTYYYKVSAYNALGESSQSSLYASATTPFSTGFSGTYYKYSNGVYDYSTYITFYDDGSYVHTIPNFARNPSTYEVSGNNIYAYVYDSELRQMFNIIDSSTLNLYGTQYRKI